MIKKIIQVLLLNVFILVCFLFGSDKISPKLDKIEEIKQGKKKIAYASWWGFDPEDSTEALQAAIDSNAEKVIIDNVGNPWVVSKTINLPSNKEIIFEEGVIIEAKQGSFLGKGDCLFLASLQKNLILNGYGATLRMRKLDYTKPPYERSEWRHILSIRSCENVKVYGLTLASSGGDGIYLGVSRRNVPNKNIHIKDVVCIDNHRQGISVISAEDLIIENVVMKNTSGTIPMAGIDFEPNESTEKLSNILMRNCISENNAGDGFVFCLTNLNSNSYPVSIRLENCIAVGNNRGVSITTGNSKDGAVNGIIEFVDCKFENTSGAGILISQKPSFGLKIKFVRCEINNAAIKQSIESPISFVSRTNNFEPIGGVEFIDCLVRDNIERLPITYFDFAGGLKLDEITGKITLIKGEQKKEYKLNQELLSQWFPVQSIKDFPEKYKGRSLITNLEPLISDAKFPEGITSNSRFRGQSEFLIWANTGEKVNFTLIIQPVGKASFIPAKVNLITPSGKKIVLKDASDPTENNYDFLAEETGAFHIICDAFNATTTMKWCSHRFVLFKTDGKFHFFKTEGDFYFYVPSGIDEFGIKVSGDGQEEKVKVIILDEKGKVLEEKDNILQPYQFVIKREDSSKGEVFIIRFTRPKEGILEDFYVQLQGIPSLLSVKKESLLKPSN